jgi:hypothetical protein
MTYPLVLDLAADGIAVRLTCGVGVLPTSSARRLRMSGSGRYRAPGSSRAG